jgi:hypothetical protein
MPSWLIFDVSRKTELAMRSSREDSIGSSVVISVARWCDDGVSEKKVRGGRLVGVEFAVLNPR